MTHGEVTSALPIFAATRETNVLGEVRSRQAVVWLGPEEVAKSSVKPPRKVDLRDIEDLEELLRGRR